VSQDPSIFTAVVDLKGRLVFDNQARQAAYCTHKFAGQCVDVTVAPQGASKSRKQESGFHAMITPWARAEGHRLDDLKRDLLLEVFGEQEHANSITGEVVMVLREPHTSKLSRVKYSELIDRTLDIAASCGVWLEAPDEHRRRTETR